MLVVAKLVAGDVGLERAPRFRTSSGPLLQEEILPGAGRLCAVTVLEMQAEHRACHKVRRDQRWGLLISIIQQALRHCESPRNCVMQLLLDHTVFRLLRELQRASQPQCFGV